MHAGFDSGLVASTRFAKQAGFVIGPLCRSIGMFPGSSVVEQPAVNRLVAGSNPASGINKFGNYAGPSGPFVVSGYAWGTRVIDFQ